MAVTDSKPNELQLAHMLQALIVAVHRAGGELRLTEADYHEALRAIAAAPGQHATIRFDTVTEPDTIVVRVVPDGARA